MEGFIVTAKSPLHISSKPLLKGFGKFSFHLPGLGPHDPVPEHGKLSDDVHLGLVFNLYLAGRYFFQVHNALLLKVTEFR